jgi:hypothetical protein
MPQDHDGFRKSSTHLTGSTTTAAGFASISVATMDGTSRASSARDAAIAFCQGTPLTGRFTESRARAGSSASIASRTTSKWLSSAARRCVLSPGESRSKDTRYLDIHEDDQLYEAQLAAWMKQASLLPGERM